MSSSNSSRRLAATRSLRCGSNFQDSVPSAGYTMENAMKWALMMLLAAVASLAQSLRVYSEFAEINAQGEVVAPQSPREILSPSIVRNGFTSFQIVLQVPKGTPVTLHVGQNPGYAVKIALYRQSGDR